MGSVWVGVCVCVCWPFDVCLADMCGILMSYTRKLIPTVNMIIIPVK